MIVVDLFREEFALREGNLADDRIIGLADGLAHVRRAEYRPILVEEPLIISEMIGIDCDDCQSQLFCTVKSSCLRSSCRPKEDLEDLEHRGHCGHRR